MPCGSRHLRLHLQSNLGRLHHTYMYESELRFQSSRISKVATFCCNATCTQVQEHFKSTLDNAWILDMDVRRHAARWPSRGSRPGERGAGALGGGAGSAGASQRVQAAGKAAAGQ